MWFWYSLISAIFFGVGQVVVKKGQKDLPPLVDNLLATGVTLLVVAPLMLTAGIDWGAARVVWPYALAVAGLFMFYYYVLDKGKVSLTATLMSAYPAVTAILSTVFLKERLGPGQILAIVLIVAGTVLLDWKSFGGGLIRLDDWMLWGLLGAAVIGTAETLTKYATEYSPASTFTFLMSLSYVPALLVCLKLDRVGRKNLGQLNFRKLGNSLLGVTLVELGLIPYNKAFSLGNAALVSAVSASRIVITVVLARLVLKEKLDRFQIFGILTILSGVVLSSL